MPTAVLDHPPVDQLAAFNKGELAAPDRARIEDHVADCDTCCALLAGMSEAPLAGLARQAAQQSTTEVSIADCPPELIDHPRYLVTGRLGAGGMGVVYRAEHRVMGRTVALKVMARKYTANRTAVERFRREVQAAARLAHPNIVTAHDADEANGTHFLVMEYVEGVSLDRLVRRRGPLPVATACQIIRQAALGLQHAHDKGMVHRDVKPHNLMVNRKGHVKVLDFGLARLAVETDTDLEGTPPTGPTVTSPSLVLGTPDYVAPEQARSSTTAGPRSDVYGLGCTLYFLLAGRPPFAASGTALEKLVAHATDPAPPLRPARPDVPPELEALVGQMLAKDPADRVASAADVATALKAFTKPAAVDADPVFVPEVLDGATPLAGLAETQPESRRPRPLRRAKQRQKAPRWLPLALGVPVVLALVALGIALSRVDTGKTKDSVPQAAATGRKVLFIIPQRGLFLPDYEPVRRRLEEKGVAVVTASTSRDECLRYYTDGGGNKSTGVRADLVLSDVKPEDYQGVIFCGGDASEFCPRAPASPEVRRILGPMKDRKVMAAICTGQEVLLRQGALHGRQVARCPRIKDQEVYDSGGARPSTERTVVTDKNFVTAAGPEQWKEFADAIAALVK